MAKTQYSFSHDPNLLGAPSGFEIPIREFRLNAGAGFVVACVGEIMTMPDCLRGRLHRTWIWTKMVICSAYSGELMQVVKREFGLYRIRIDCEDDLWTVARLCVKGRSIGMLGERRDQTTAGQEGGRAKAAEKRKCGLN